MILAIILVIGELVFSGLYRLWPEINPWIFLLSVYLVVKLLGDLLCAMTKRPGANWSYVDDYVVTELGYSYLIEAGLLSMFQLIASYYFPVGSLQWRLASTALVPTLLFGIVTRRREVRQSVSRKLGQRARVKYGME